MMDAKLHQHYLYLWRLVSSLEKDWWDKREKENITQILKSSVASDAELSNRIDIRSDKFVQELTVELQALILAKPDLPGSNLPPKETLRIFQKYLQDLEAHQEEAPLVFRDSKGKSASVSGPEIFFILKKHNLVDDDGHFKSGPKEAIIASQKEIGQRFTKQRYQQTFKSYFVYSLQNQAPVSLFTNEFFGQAGIPGIVDTLTDQLSQKATDYLYERIEYHLDKPFDPFDSRFQAALNRAVEETQTRIITGNLITPAQIETITNQFLEKSTNFTSLASKHQTEIISKTISSFQQAIKKIGSPKTVDGLKLSTDEENNLSFEITSASFQDSRREYTTLSAYPAKPKIKAQKIQERIKKEIQIEGTDESTTNIMLFIKSFSQNPLRATLNYPYYSVIQLLPKPIRRLFFPSKKSLRRKLKAWYGISVNPEAQRQILENIGLRVFQNLGRLFGFYTKDREGNYHFILASAIGWVGNQIGTRAGEFLAKITEKIPLIGSTASRIFRRRLGKEKDREKTLAAGIINVFFDFSLALLKIIPKVFWVILKKLPFVQTLKISLINQYLALETQLHFLKTIALAKNISFSFIKGLFSLNTLAGGLIGFGISGGSPLGAIIGGLTGGAYQGWLNLAKILTLNPRILSLLQASGGNFFDKILRLFGKPGLWLYKHGWLRLPFKGTALGYLMYLGGAPLWACFIPPLLEWAWQTKSWWVPTVGKLLSKIPVLARVGQAIASFLSRFAFLTKIIGFLSKALHVLGTVFGLSLWFIPVGLEVLAGVPLTTALTHWLQTGFLPIGFGIHLYALIKGVSLLAALGQIGNFIYGAFNAIGSLFASLGAGMGLTLLAAVGLLVGGTIFAIINFSSVFIEEKALRKGVISAYIPITKILVSTEKDSQDEVVALNYTLTYGYRSGAPGVLDNIQIRDRFEHTGKPKTYVFLLNKHFWFQYQLGKPKEIVPSSFAPCEPDIMDNYFLWFNKEVPELIGEKSTCGSEKIGPLNPGETKTITMRLVLKKPLNKILKNGQFLCNRFGVSGEALEGERHFSSLSICISQEGKLNTKAAAELAEKIIGELKNCGFNKINQSNLEQIESCLASAGISQLAIKEIKMSASNPGFGNKLQCVGFVNAVEAATGGVIQNSSFVNAKAYWRNIQGYRKISKNNYHDIMAGDILIWTSGENGHMAVVTQSITDSDGKLVKITLAEAMGNDGKIRFRQLPVIDSGIDSAGLTGWLRRSY